MCFVDSQCSWIIAGVCWKLKSTIWYNSNTIYWATSRNITFASLNHMQMHHIDSLQCIFICSITTLVQLGWHSHFVLLVKICCGYDSINFITLCSIDWPYHSSPNVQWWLNRPFMTTFESKRDRVQIKV